VCLNEIWALAAHVDAVPPLPALVVARLINHLAVVATNLSWGWYSHCAAFKDEAGVGSESVVVNMLWQCVLAGGWRGERHAFRQIETKAGAIIDFTSHRHLLHSYKSLTSRGPVPHPSFKHRLPSKQHGEWRVMFLVGLVDALIVAGMVCFVTGVIGETVGIYLIKLLPL
jgi:hypothetical protein